MPDAARTQTVVRDQKRRTLPYIFAELPACTCGCVDFDLSGGTVRNKDGSKCQYATCLNCREPSKIIWDIPETCFRLTDKPNTTTEK